MADTIVLHVGPHKTGTTALQHALASNADRLARHSILYPETGRSGWAHHDVATACREGGTELLDALSAVAERQRVLFLSSENFATLDREALGRLKAYFPSSEFKVVYFLRRLAALWPSHWREMVKHGHELTFGDYLLQAASGDLRPYIAPPLPGWQLENFSSVFGSSALRLPVYDAHHGASRDFGPEVINELFGPGHEAEHFATQRLNLTAPNWQVELVRFFNLLARGRLRYAEKVRLRQALLSHIQRSPPKWLPRFVGMVNRAETVVLTEASPLVQAQQSEVVARFSYAFLNPADTYLAPVRISVPLFDVRMLASEDIDAVEELFTTLSNEVRRMSASKVG